MKVEDGTGKGYLVRVDKNNRAHTQSLTQTAASNAAAENNDAYKFSSGIVNITTTGSFSGLLYIKNTDTRRFVISAIRVSCDDKSQWRLVKNPTGGTLITNAVAANENNTTFNGTKVFSGDSYKGVNGDTITGGLNFDQVVGISGPYHDWSEGSIVLGKDNTIAIEVKPSVAADCTAMISGYYLED